MPESVSVEVLSTHTPALFADAVKRAAELLRAGEVVALPTETVYGLAANAFEAKAVAKIYEIKGRPAHNPIIVHVADLNLAKQCASEWPAIADQLAAAFWPGPLTLILPRSDRVPDNVTAGGSTVGIRWPSHPFVQAVIHECGFPLAAPSANPSNAVSPTNAGHVQKQLGDKLQLIVDGGQSQVGIESTVLDLTVSPPRILRPGMIDEDAIAAVVGNISSGAMPAISGALRSPGLLQKHYSPKAKLKILNWRDDADLRAQLKSVSEKKTHIIAHSHIPSDEGWARVSVIPLDAEAFARAIYAELHRCDAAGAEWIVVEAPPETSEWRAIADRLHRAAAS
ncbi:MAG TPA: L-threonylcarbamoyladenylate synthase [Verrucomicrobiae bacterium]|nr:L-threonylcarbamoyladenylate synthase [Verrucomicrobiae bacterium]